jgi:tetratricopeptide (TPR) repeat protein
VENVAGKISLQLLGNGCLGIDTRATNEINEFLSEFPKTGPRLQEMIDRSDVELAEKVEEIEDWAKKYRELTKSVRDESTAGGLNKKAANLLRDGDLEQAAERLDQLMRQVQNGTDQAARTSYNRAQAYELQLQAAKTWPLYEKAYSERPDDFRYGFAYATALARQNQLMKAIQVSEQAVKHLRQRASGGLSFSQFDLATNLSNLADLYVKTRRISDAERTYQQCLLIYRALAKGAPATYQVYVAATLNHLGDLYRAMRQAKGTEKVYQEALAIDRDLAAAQPAAYQTAIVQTLNRLAILYSDTERVEEAKAAYQEALAIDRAMAVGNPPVYQAHVASDLNNLAILLQHALQIQEAERTLQDALAICRNGEKDDPATYQPVLGLTLQNFGNLYSETNRNERAEQAYQEALALRRELAQVSRATYQPEVAATLYSLADLYSAARRVKGCRTRFPRGAGDLSRLGELESRRLPTSSCHDTQ